MGRFATWICAFAAGLVLPVPAHAIPAPDIIIASATGLGQIAALLTAALGGAGLFGTRFGKGLFRDEGGRRSRVFPWVAGAGALLLLASFAVNLKQWQDGRDARLERLAETLTRPARIPGQPVADPTLIEISYRQQVGHPLGISTEEFASLLEKAQRGEVSGMNLLDVRERPEFETGGIAGLTQVRWPDLGKQAGVLKLSEREAIAVCHNGNRSYETCAALAKEGVKCRFVIGGLQKWIAEGRPTVGVYDRDPATLRAIPRYHNDRVLLDTPDVRRLVDEEKAIFVDVRYPGEFKAGHLPNAINLPVRITPTDVLAAKLAELPKRPIVLPCYDRRGCFLADVLGYELSIAGLDFRGRFTLPWEYFPRSEPLPHLADYQARMSRTWTDAAIESLAGAIAQVSMAFGTLLAGILALALASRALVLPFALKGERDQIVLRRLAPELAALKSRHADDRVRRAQALKEIYGRHGITPLRNLGSLAFFPLFLISLTSLDAAGRLVPSSFLWIASLEQPDPWFVLPVAFGVLVGAYVQQTVTLGRVGLGVLGAGVLALVALMAPLSAAANLYAVISMALVMTQRALTVWWIDRAAQPRAAPGGVAPLADAHRFTHVGNKAARLGRMLAASFPVPDGVALSAQAFEGVAGGAAINEAAARRLAAEWRRLGLATAAVRSSGLNEDGERQSFAGVFDTVLGVTEDKLMDAIGKVRASFKAARTQALGGGDTGGVVIQRMVPAEYAGVLFTEDVGHPGAMRVELVEGLGDKLVSGGVTPRSFLLARGTGAALDGGKPPIDLAPLAEHGRAAERLFGGAQDIEWAYANGRFWLLQARDVTGAVADSRTPIERERARLLRMTPDAAPDAVLFAQNEMSALVPQPTPMTLSLLNAMWADGGGVQRAARALGLRYDVAEEAPPYLVTVFGRLYVNRREEARRMRPLGATGLRLLARSTGRMESQFRNDFLPDFEHEMTLLNAIDFDTVEPDELAPLFARICRRFVTETHTQAEVVNLAAAAFMHEARAALARRGLDPVLYLGGIPATAAATSLAAARSDPDPAKWRRREIAALGHRAPVDYELAIARFREAPTFLDVWVAGTAGFGVQGKSDIQAELAGWRDAGLGRSVERARRFQVFKEDAKHHVLREYAVLRAMLLALDRRVLGGQGKIFWLEAGEAARLAEPGFAAEALRIAAGRESAAAELAAVSDLPVEITRDYLETAAFGAADAKRQAARAGDLKGTLVAGRGPIVGRAHVVAARNAELGLPLGRLIPGDIVVSRFVHPNWTSEFSTIRGIVCEVGGWLSHTAIQAREHGLPMVVGVQGLDTIRNGEWIKVENDGQIQRVDAAGKTADKRVFVLYPRTSPAYDAAIGKILSEFGDKAINAEFTGVNFYNDDTAGKAALAQAIEGQYDLILSMGSESTAWLFQNYRGGRIPVVSVCSKDPVLLGQAQAYEKGSEGNFAFTSLNAPIEAQMDGLLELKPELKNLAILVDRKNESAVRTQAEPMANEAARRGIQVVMVAVRDPANARDELASLMPKAVTSMRANDPALANSLFWITGSTSVFREIAVINATAGRVPVLSAVPEVVKAGDDSAVLSIGVSFESNASMAAGYAADLLSARASAADLKVGSRAAPDIAINLRKARQIGLEIPDRLIESAAKIYDGEDRPARQGGQLAASTGVN